jgi:hypothetical protein
MKVSQELVDFNNSTGPTSLKMSAKYVGETTGSKRVSPGPFRPEYDLSYI